MTSPSPPETLTRAPTLLAVFAAVLLVLACADGVAGPGRGDLARHLEELAREAGETQVVRGDGPWLFFAPELRHLAIGPFWGDDAAAASRAEADPDPLPAILDVHRQLAERDIELLFVPVPAKAAIVPTALPGVETEPARRLDGHDAAFLALLEAEGVRVLDLYPTFVTERDAAAERPDGDDDRLYTHTDTHWSSYGARVAAAAIAEEIGDPAWRTAAPRLELAVQPRRVQIEGDLWRRLPEPRPPREELVLHTVGRPRADGSVEPVAPSRSSPVLLLGDSHALVFHAGGDLHATASGLPDHLARELGMAVDLVAVRGSGATPARLNLLRRGDGLSGKRLVVWCLSVREYTEGQGWRVLPLSR